MENRRNPARPSLETLPRDAVSVRLELTASMLRDLENGGPIEADHFEGYMLEKAQANRVSDGMLVVTAPYLKAYKARRA